MAYQSRNPRHTSLTVGGTKNASAAIDITSTTQGLGLPNMTETQRDAISTPKEGLMVFNTTTKQVNTFANSVWNITASATPDVAGLVTAFVSTVKSGIKAVASTNYTVLDTDGFDQIDVTTGSSDRTITLPTASANANRILYILKVDTGTGDVIVDGEGSETINGATTQTVGGQYSYIKVRCNGTEWFILDLYEEGTYTPTVSGTSNVSTSGIEVASYSRVGNTVTVVGLLSANPGSGTATFQLDLPVATANFTLRGQAAGLGIDTQTSSPLTTYSIVAKTSAQTVEFATVNSSDEANADISFSFTYRIQ